MIGWVFRRDFLKLAAIAGAKTLVGPSLFLRASEAASPQPPSEGLTAYQEGPKSGFAGIMKSSPVIAPTRRKNIPTSFP